MTVGFLIELAVRCLLVVLFLPFSALDKIIDFRGSVAQAKQTVPFEGAAVALILAGLFVETFMSLGIVTGIADRLAAFVLSGYCVVTALLWKQFWVPGDFWRTGESKGRDLFWDFLKNLSLAGGFLLITFGTTDMDIGRVLDDPFASSHPYTVHHVMGQP
jgi:putative oxidoreductase